MCIFKGGSFFFILDSLESRALEAADVFFPKVLLASTTPKVESSNTTPQNSVRSQVKIFVSNQRYIVWNILQTDAQVWSQH